MKKITMTISMLLAVVFAFAQDNPIDDKGTYGVRLSGTYSNIAFDDYDVDFTEGRVAPMVTFMAEYNITDKFKIQPELSFAFVGNHTGPHDGSILSDDRQRTNYLVLPVLAKFYFSEKFYLDIGPYGAINLWEFEDALGTWDYGAVGGLGFMVNENWFIDARYNFGLANVFNDDKTDVEGSTRYFMVGIGYKI